MNFSKKYLSKDIKLKINVCNLNNNNLIIVAEDDDDIAAILTGYLRKAGMKTLRAEDGEQAINLTRLNKPDLFNPLNDVAYSLKQISQGNLSARAFNSSSKLGEMNRLVNDFNEMAEKLQTLDAQRNLWNAAIAHELRTPVTILRGRLQGQCTKI